MIDGADWLSREAPVIGLRERYQPELLDQDLQGSILRPVVDDNDLKL